MPLRIPAKPNAAPPLMALLLLIAATTSACADGPVTAEIDTTLPTHGEQIRQFALDGDETTVFESDRAPAAADHFTIVLDRPVALKSVVARTGRAEGVGTIGAGVLEVSADGQTFEKLAGFADGKAEAGPAPKPIRAIRIRPGASSMPIAIREVSIDSDPPVAPFRYPVEFVLKNPDAPDLNGWAEKAIRASIRAYPMINDELASDGYRPPRLIVLTVSSRYDGVAAASGDRIVASVDFFRKHPDDIGAIVHETVHVVQAYRNGNNPHWLVEGISDYIRFFRFEPGKLGRIDRATAHYDSSYRVSAAFIAFLVERYDPQIVRKLNAAMRAGRYDDNLVSQITGKTLGVLDDEWRATLRP